MITQKKLMIPIFDIALKIIIFDKWEEVQDIAGTKESKGITMAYEDNSCIVVAIDKNYPSSIVHEAEHIKNFIWMFIGYRPMADNDEVDAYLLKYLYNKIVDVFYKHVGEKPL